MFTICCYEIETFEPELHKKQSNKKYKILLHYDIYIYIYIVNMGMLSISINCYLYLIISGKTLYNIFER